MATGLTEVTWILRAIRASAESVEGFLDWPEFALRGRGVFLWEAFITGGAKGADHRADARIAVELFALRLQAGSLQSDVNCESPHSLIGAALLATRWSENISLLHKPCLVLRAAS